MGLILAPEPISATHVLERFDCGHVSLNDWLKKRAAKASRVGNSARTYVACNAEQEVLGFYALSTGAVNRNDVPGKVSRNMPNPVPVILLGRLAVDLTVSGQGVGAGLLKDAFLRVVQAAGQIGVRALLVHAIDENARSFYLKNGFYDSPTNEMTLMLTVDEIRRELMSLGGSNN